MSSNELLPKSDDTQTHPESDGLRRLFGRRQAFKLRPRQARLMNELLPKLEVHLSESNNLDLREVTGTAADTTLHLEIGFGGGEHLVAQARAHPEIQFVGCEPFVNGMGKILGQIDGTDISNIRLFAGDARRLVEQLGDASLDAAYILFPDPWPKTRHHKRRYVQDATLTELARVLKPGGRLRIASDIPGYIRWTLEHMARQPNFVWTAETCEDWRKRPDDWPPTRYEQKALKAGRVPSYLEFRRS